jgi:hypothetical protein
MTDTHRAKARQIRDALIPIQASLDQLVKQADEEGVRITHETIQSLLTEKVALEGMAAEAYDIGNQRLVAEVNAEIMRAMQGLGLLPRKRRRG